MNDSRPLANGSPALPSDGVLEELRGPLAEFGRQWARSPYRPRPTEAALQAWDTFLNSWIASGLPLVLRRHERDACSNGREVIFADNTPANWAFGLALEGVVPDLSSWTSDTIENHVPLSLIARLPGVRRDLNKAGWKVCHIEPVSDRKRRKIGSAPMDIVEAAFRRFLSPRNVLLVPKLIAGAGELPEVVEAVRKFEQMQPTANVVGPDRNRR